MNGATIFSGMSAFPITPADQDGQVYADDLCRILTRLIDAKVDSIGLLGSTGTYAYLTRSERRRATEAAVECVDGQTPLIVGIGALRTDEALALAEDAARAGANGLLLAPVSYTPLTSEEVYHHYTAVAAATDLPMCIYNNPGTTHFSFDTELLARLAAHPTIRAVKMPLPGNGDAATDLHSLQQKLPDGFSIGYSGDWGCAHALLAGANCWYSVVGGILPEPSLRLARAAQSGDLAETQRINDHFAPLWRLFQEFGGLRVVFALAQILELTNSQPPRPILPLIGQDLERIRQALVALDAVS